MEEDEQLSPLLDDMTDQDRTDWCEQLFVDEEEQHERSQSAAASQQDFARSKAQERQPDPRFRKVKNVVELRMPQHLPRLPVPHAPQPRGDAPLPRRGWLRLPTLRTIAPDAPKQARQHESDKTVQRALAFFKLPPEQRTGAKEQRASDEKHVALLKDFAEEAAQECAAVALASRASGDASLVYIDLVDVAGVYNKKVGERRSFDRTFDRKCNGGVAYAGRKPPATVIDTTPSSARHVLEAYWKLQLPDESILDTEVDPLQLGLLAVLRAGDALFGSGERFFEKGFGSRPPKRGWKVTAAPARKAAGAHAAAKAAAAAAAAEEKVPVAVAAVERKELTAAQLASINKAAQHHAAERSIRLEADIAAGRLPHFLNIDAAAKRAVLVQAAGAETVGWVSSINARVKDEAFQAALKKLVSDYNVGSVGNFIKKQHNAEDETTPDEEQIFHQLKIRSGKNDGADD